MIKKITIFLLLVITHCAAALVAFNTGYFQGVQDNPRFTFQEHALCRSSKTHTAWVAVKGEEKRCFLEHKEYPHRVKGSYLD